jgi:DNA mismatch repair protein MutS
MMAQYRRIKGELPKDALLLFRLGDFYEMFFEDAQSGAQLLNVALTRRGSVPMCGIPFHAASAYIGKLLRAGKKVAICDQVEDARKGQLVRREVTQILSPGAHFDEHMLAAERNNYLAAVCQLGELFGLALMDLTTGGFMASELAGDAALLTELQRLRPAEVVYPSEKAVLRELLGGGAGGVAQSERSLSYGWSLAPYEDWVFAAETAIFTLKEHFKLATLDGFGLRDRTAASCAAGGVLHYVTEHLRRQPSNVVRLSFFQRSDFLILDHNSLRHLEVLEPLHRDAPRNACLFGALNRTTTPMGARKLREWLSQPLSDSDAICRRQDAIAAMVDDAQGCAQLRGRLGEVRDLERTAGRLSAAAGNARDLAALRLALEQLPGTRDAVQRMINTADARTLREVPPLIAGDSGPRASPQSLLAALRDQITEMPELADKIRTAIVDVPPIALKDGGMIRDGYDAALDELRQATRGGKEWIAKLQQDEITNTGIGSLKVRFNSVFGYYIEVTKSNLDKVPAHYIRKQTIANGERFITPELKEMEGKILGAEDRAVKLEYEIFQKVREAVVAELRILQSTAEALAQLDVLACFAEVARTCGYRRPVITRDGSLIIREGRHPVLEQNPVQERFVPNDTMLDDSTRIALITGPNMAGKSTYIRQVALLALMAHTGSFLPAQEARIGVIDRIFTRIGASDDLARGQSTFMVEMCETAEILNNATRQSLVILDEIGRGTSTFDGLSLAWSIVEHLHNVIGANTLFATHYHELTELAQRLPRLKNYNVAVREWHDHIVFLRKIVEGGTDKSYGIQVARLAGVPKPVLERSKEILRNLEDSELTPEGNVRRAPARDRDRNKLQNLGPPPQLDLFA